MSCSGVEIFVDYYLVYRKNFPETKLKISFNQNILWYYLIVSYSSLSEMLILFIGSAIMCSPITRDMLFAKAF